MGCWNETCALSGLPIYGGDECYRIVFDDSEVKRLAFRAINNPTDWLEWVQDIEIGAYNEHGRIRGTENLNNIGDGSVFVLKRFWDLAPSMTPEYASECFEHHMRNRNACKELLEIADTQSGRNTIANLLDVNGSDRIYEDHELCVGFFHVAWLMAMLRRNFYTASYRGAQSDLQPFIEMNDHIQEYLKEKR